MHKGIVVRFKKKREKNPYADKRAEGKITETTKGNLRTHTAYSAAPTACLWRKTTSLCKNTKRHGAGKAPQLFAFIQGHKKTGNKSSRQMKTDSVVSCD